MKISCIATHGRELENKLNCGTMRAKIRLPLMDHVDYRTLDSAKNAFIAASRKTLKFARSYGFVPDATLGRSSNVFALGKNLFVTLVAEGLGTADEARPEDLTVKEQQEFWFNIGIKTVSVMSNDVACSVMQPVLLSLYLPSSTPELVFTKTFMKGFLNGIVEGCRQVGCVYFSGETPQLKSKLYPGKLDIAGAVFGMLPPGVKPIDGSRLGPGNTMVFIGSNGPNENGFTTLRALAGRLQHGYRSKLPSGTEYWKAINNRSHLYTPFIQSLLKEGVQPTAIEPITGHGWQKIMRSKKPLRYVVTDMLAVPEVFTFVEQQLRLDPARMIEIFNYGLGLVVFVENKLEAKQAITIAKKHKLKAIVGGHVERAKEREVPVLPLKTKIKGRGFILQQ